jgi:hypothetical protein
MSTRTPSHRWRGGLHLALVPVAMSWLGGAAPLKAAAPSWTSPDRYRILLTVDPRGQHRSNSPASASIDFAQVLAARGVTGAFDKDTVEVIAYDAAGNPRTFDATRPGYEQYLLPWRIDGAFGITQVTLGLVIPDETYTQYAVYFDTVQSGLGRPDRYPGLVGDGDRFVEGYKRREINAYAADSFCDFDGDGDLDLFKAGVEPYVYVYENVGSNRLVDRGRLTSGGNVLQFPMDGNNRSAQSIEFHDWDGDGDQDLFVYAPVGQYGGKVVCFENITTGGPLTFASPVILWTQSGRTLGTPVRFVDFDGDGKTDVIGFPDGLIGFYRNVGTSGSISSIQLADEVYLKANGIEIELMSTDVDFGDMDGDGDLDMFVASSEGRVFYFENVGTRTQPVFAMGRLVAAYEYMDLMAGVKVYDFDDDGLLDFVVGRCWERTQWGEQPRVYGRLYKNIGTATAPKFEARDASNGAPYTEQFQIADAVRQNGVRAVDWNNDGKTDLIAGDTDGFVWYFQNTTNQLFPVFAPGVKLQAGGQPLRVYGEDGWYDSGSGTFVWTNRAAGYARVDICDWNNDGRKDLLVADGRAWLWLYLNTGTDADPVLGAGTRVMANGRPIDGTARGSVLVCDWNNDGKKDVIFGMAINENAYSEYHDWPLLSANWWMDGGFLFYKNTGSDASPVLAAPTWVKSGPGSGSVITYSRPNLGDFVDWDGDGKKDFIGCEFENSARFYKNTGSGAPNTEPVFSGSDGVHLVQPFTVQMMSGADAIDWNRDGNMDIITGQGHGASGLRFYERDYINDFVNDTFPIVTVGQTESRLVQADFDQDGDVDQEDFGHLQGCFTGDAFSYGPGCADADLDVDGDVDGYDIAILLDCMSGPGQPPGC